MNFKRQSRYFRLGVTAFLVIAASLLFYFLLFKTSSLASGLSKVIHVLNPVFYGFAIAYLLNPVMIFLEKLMLRFLLMIDLKPGRRLRTAIRIIATLVSLFIVLLLFYNLISRIIPELIESINGIVNNFSTYIDNAYAWMDGIFTSIGNGEISEGENAALEYIYQYADKMAVFLEQTVQPKLDDVITQLTSSIMQVAMFFKNLLLGVIISIYVLIYKDSTKARVKRFIFAVFNITTGNRVLHNLRFIDRKFGGFLIGKILDSFIIGFICFVCMSILKLPYPLLVAIFIGVTNIIPFFGPFIGAIPSVILIFFVEPVQALYFLILILILQQFDGNILGPRILGNSVGVSSFMVLVSIIVCGGFFGFAGMIIGVPLFAVATAIVQDWIIKQNIRKGIPGDINDYRELWKIDPETREPITDRPLRGKISLYESIKYQSREIRECNHDINVKSWEKTVDSVRRDINYNKWSKEMERKKKPVSVNKESEEKLDESDSLE